MTYALLSGWGRTPVSGAHIEWPESAGDLHVPDGPRGAIARGLGRSYGDSAQNGGGTVFDLTRMGGIHLDEATGLTTIAAGTSLADVLEVAVPRGWFLPVTPGTKHVTAGGALAADVHGKNHHIDGTFARHVEEFHLFTASGELVRVMPGEDAFRATAGGMGLTGVVASVVVRMLPIETSRILVDTARTADLDGLLTAMEEGDEQYRYSVAWIDLMARGTAMGRGVLTRGDHAPRAALGKVRSTLAYRPRRALDVPDVWPTGLLNRLSVGAFNEAWFRTAPRNRIGEIQTLERFFYPLDFLGRWNHLYGRSGMLQYQVALPTGTEETLRQLVGELSRRRLPAFLAVLKRFGPGTGLLSFPIEGWTLALDIPARLSGLGPILHRLDEAVLASGGRTYLAKDSRVRPEVFAAMYPELDEWREIRSRLDPDGVWRSDQSRRLGLG